MSDLQPHPPSQWDLVLDCLEPNGISLSDIENRYGMLRPEQNVFRSKYEPTCIF